MDKNTLVGTSTVLSEHKYGAVILAGKSPVYNEDRTEIVGEREALQFVSDELICTFVGEPRPGQFGMSTRLSFKKQAELAVANAVPLTVWVNEQNLGLLDAVKIGGRYNITGAYIPKGVRPSGEVRPESVSLRQLYIQ